MKVLHVTSGNLFGGVETLLTTLARHAPAVNWMEPAFALAFDGELRRRLEQLGSTVTVLGGVQLRNPLSVLRARRELRKLIDQTAPDVVVCHSAWSIAVFGSSVRAMKTPLVLWLHDAADREHWLYRLARRTRPDRVITNSRYTAGTLDGFYPGVPIEVIYYPVAPPVTETESSARGQIRDEAGTPYDDVVIVQVSRMESWKGHLLHLRALGKLKNLAGWTLWLVGGVQRPAEARYREEIERLAASLGIEERIRFLGQRSDVGRVMSAADIHCQPNEGPEPFGIVFLEAMYAGLPNVTTLMGGPPEILEEDYGVLVPPGDVGALAESLSKLIRDSERRLHLGSLGPIRAKALCDPEKQLFAVAGSLSRTVRAA